MWLGLGSVESTVPSLVKSHAHEVGVPVDASVNWTVSGAGAGLWVSGEGLQPVQQVPDSSLIDVDPVDVLAG